MSPGLEPRLASLLVYGVALLGAHTVLRRRRTPEKRRREGDEWARRHLAYVETRWTPDVDRCLDRNRRVHLWGAAFLGLALWSVPPSWGGLVASLAVVPAVVAIARGYTATRPDYLPPGPRVARAREVSMSDYLSPFERLAMWATVAGVASLALVRAAGADGWAALAAVVLVAAAVAVEVTGTRFSRAPEPAGDAAHLYWQDAMRADVLRSAAGFVQAGAALMGIALIGFADDFHIQVALVTTLVLLGPSLVLDSRARATPAAYMRSRLWPTLAPDQVLRPGEPVPCRGAVA